MKPGPELSWMPRHVKHRRARNACGRVKIMRYRDLQELEKTIGYSFQNQALMQQAMRHSSYANEHRHLKQEDNERLEFLGDAVLELVSSEYLFRSFPDLPEGEMTKLRASLVCEPTLAMDAREIGLPVFLRLGNGEERTGGRERDSIVSDALEALIGAIYLDGSFASAKEFVLRFVLNDIEHKKLFHDSKTILQEMVQKEYKGEGISYVLIAEEGPDHAKRFSVEARLGERTLGLGTGATKKAAEQEAAYRAIVELKGQMHVSENH